MGAIVKFLYRQAIMATPNICSEMFILALRKRTHFVRHVQQNKTKQKKNILYFKKHFFPQFQLCRAYKSCGPGGPPHVKIVVEWDKETKE